jgi:hypothetical protein
LSHCFQDWLVSANPGFRGRNTSNVFFHISCCVADRSASQLKTAALLCDGHYLHAQEMWKNTLLVFRPLKPGFALTSQS